MTVLRTYFVFTTYVRFLILYHIEIILYTYFIINKDVQKNMLVPYFSFFTGQAYVCLLCCNAAYGYFHHVDGHAGHVFYVVLDLVFDGAHELFQAFAVVDGDGQDDGQAVVIGFVVFGYFDAVYAGYAFDLA